MTIMMWAGMLSLPYVVFLIFLSEKMGKHHGFHPATARNTLIILVLALLPFYVTFSYLGGRQDDRFNEAKAYLAYRAMIGCAHVDAVEHRQAPISRYVKDSHLPIMRCTGQTQGYGNSNDYYEANRHDFHDVFWHLPLRTVPTQEETH